MRFLREIIGVAGVLAAFAVVQAFVGGRELEHVAPTTRLPNLPSSSLLASAGLGLMLVLYAWLGRIVARSGAPAASAAASGALAGFAAGLVAGIAQAWLQADFFRDVLLAYSLSDAFLGPLLIAIVIVEPLAGALTGGLVAWLSCVLLRPARRVDPV